MILCELAAEMDLKQCCQDAGHFRSFHKVTGHNHQPTSLHWKNLVSESIQLCKEYLKIQIPISSQLSK